MARAVPKTGVSEAFERVKEALSVNGVHLDDFDKEVTEDVYNTLSMLWSRTQRETKEEIAARLDVLGDGRLEYVREKDRNPETGTDIELMGGTQAMVYGEATGAKWLARIIRGESDRGWLPSWRWG